MNKRNVYQKINKACPSDCCIIVEGIWDCSDYYGERTYCLECCNAGIPNTNCESIDRKVVFDPKISSCMGYIPNLL